MNDDDWLKKRKRGPRGGCASLGLGGLVALLGLQACPAPPEEGGPGGARVPGAGGPGGGPGAPPHSAGIEGARVGAPGGVGNGPAPRKAPPGTSPAEHLESSWRAELAISVPPLSDAATCPDADGDGFPSALACPTGDPAGLDCDDTDPDVTPATERWVRPGPFIMGSASDHAGSDEAPVHVVQLSGYCLDVHEVSAGDFGAWLRSTGRTAEGPDLRSLSPSGEVEAGRAAHPAEGVTWAEARDYCVAQGKALPTEAQWEKAARGGCELGRDAGACELADLRPYPWGDAAPTCELANHQLSAEGMPRLCVSDTLEVGGEDAGGEEAAGAGPYGHQHLAGNVWEYVADPWHPGTYASAGPAGREDPAGPLGGEVRVLRGGGWNTFSTNMRAANRFHDLVLGTAAGFRCARPTVEPQVDEVVPLELVTLSGSLSHESGSLTGRAAYVSVFDAADADENGQLAPGRSPVAEAKLLPDGGETLAFSLAVPAGGPYLVQAALDAGTGGDKAAYVSASGSGGFGTAAENPVSAEADVSGLSVVLSAPLEGGPAAAQGPGGGPGKGGLPGMRGAPGVGGPGKGPGDRRGAKAGP